MLSTQRNQRASVISLAVSLVVLSFAAAVHAEDWPQLLGPSRDGVYRGSAKLAATWPDTGPAILWKKKVGEGFASPVIADKKLVLFHRQADRMVLDCFDTLTGKAIWSTGYDTTYSDDMRKGDGPRATPAIADGKVVAFGPDGVLLCADLATGKTLWQLDTRKLYKTPGGFFGRACSPVIEGDLVLLNIGGPEHGIGAFDLKTGALKWHATGDEAGYASPICATIKDTRYAFFFTRTGLIATDPKTGDIFFQHRWRSRQHASVNATTPLVVDSLLFLTSSYQTGATVLAIDGKKFETLWAGDDILSSQYANIVHKDGHLFGFDGRNDFGDTKLRCVDLKTGAVKWTKDELPAGPIVLAGDRLIVLLESGEMQFIEASAKQYALLAKAKLLTSPVRSNPALVDGILYAKDDGQMIAVDLREK